ncbi:hypothetical protein LUZ60_012684 [Juncus effusus]|nr:hypothetical protein LUZ60_012684 [Juncus effusus]
MIIKLLSILLSMEVVALAALLFKNPLHRIAMACIERLKTDTGLIVVKTVLCTMLALLCFDFYFVVKFHDHVMLSHLRALIVGYCLFLMPVIGRVHLCNIDLIELEKINISMKIENSECELMNETLRKQITELEKNSEAIEQHNMALEEVMMKMKAYCEEKHAHDQEESRRKARLDEIKAACMPRREKEQDVASSVTLVSLTRRRRAYIPWYYH